MENCPFLNHLPTPMSCGFIIKSGFQSRTGYNGACMVLIKIIYNTIEIKDEYPLSECFIVQEREKLMVQSYIIFIGTFWYKMPPCTPVSVWCSMYPFYSILTLWRSRGWWSQDWNWPTFDKKNSHVAQWKMLLLFNIK